MQCVRDALNDATKNLSSPVRMHVHLQGVLFEPANSEATQNIERNIEQDAEIDPSVPRATIVTTIKHADPKGFVPSSIMGLG